MATDHTPATPAEIGDPAALMERLVFPDRPVEPADVPPRPSEDVVAVHRTVDLIWPVGVDVRVRAEAAARGLTLEQLIRQWAEHELGGAA